MRDPLLIVKSVRVTEKGTALAEKHNQYVLKVAPSATKQEIKHAVKVLFQKTAVRVNTMQVAGKLKRRHGGQPTWASAPTGKKPSSPSRRAKRSNSSNREHHHGTQNFSSPHAVAPLHAAERLRGNHHRATSRSASSPKRIKKSGGRNNSGRITSRHIGGGHKQRYRFIDFKRNKLGIKAMVESIEYDPTRTARIALLKYTDGEQRYIIAPVGLDGRHDAQQRSRSRADHRQRASARQHSARRGHPQHRDHPRPRRADRPHRRQQRDLMSVDAGYAQVRLPSGEIRKIFAKCYATIGQVGNIEHENVSLGKAGRSRWLGRRPHVRGMVMNPVDHPMGGGQGKSKGGGGRQHPVSPWGQPAKGLKTRPKYKPSNKFIVERRKNKKH